MTRATAGQSLADGDDPGGSAGKEGGFRSKLDTVHLFRTIRMFSWNPCRGDSDESAHSWSGTTNATSSPIASGRSSTSSASSITKRGYPPTLREIGEPLRHPLDQRRQRSPEGAGEEGLPPARGSRSRAPCGRSSALGKPRRAARSRRRAIARPGRGRRSRCWPSSNVTRTPCGSIASSSARTREVFALRVKGDSMIEDGIFDGDYIFVRKQLQANRARPWSR